MRVVGRTQGATLNVRSGDFEHPWQCTHSFSQHHLQVSGGTEPLEVRRRLAAVLPNAPPPDQQTVQEPAILHTTLARLVETPMADGGGPGRAAALLSVSLLLTLPPSLFTSSFSPGPCPSGPFPSAAFAPRPVPALLPHLPTHASGLSPRGLISPLYLLRTTGCC